MTAQEYPYQEIIPHVYASPITLRISDHVNSAEWKCMWKGWDNNTVRVDSSVGNECDVERGFSNNRI